MNHPKFGTKYTCHSCAAKYFDMKKPNPVCPKCGANPKDDPALTATAKKGKAKEEGEGEDFDEDKFDTDMDDLVNDDEAEDDEPEEEPAGNDE